MPDPFLGEIRVFPWNVVPEGWLPCDGREMSTQKDQALHSLLGTRFGGNGKKTFNLPDLRGRTPVHAAGNKPGAATGAEMVALTGATMPAHTHGLFAVTTAANAANATNLMLAAAQPVTNTNVPRNIYGTGPQNAALDPSSIATEGADVPHDNMQPFLVLNYCIAVKGTYPPR